MNETLKYTCQDMTAFGCQTPDMSGKICLGGYKIAHLMLMNLRGW